MTPRVLISYSWDSDGHKDWVRELSERLRLNGVDVRLDQWHVALGQSLTQFMESEITKADYVLVICTPNYYRKSLEREGGVGYEQQIITGRIASGVPREKFIPILREGSFSADDNMSLPPHFLGTYALDMRVPEQHAFETLVRTLFGKPASPPELGAAPKWLGLTDAQQGNNLRLSVFDIEGWELLSGVAQHQRTPETFYLPAETERQALSPGCFVKLQFRIRIDEPDQYTDEDAGFVERMWVRVTGASGPYYTGTLSNQPATADEQEVLRFGSPVTFLPEHVIDIKIEASDA